MCLICVEIERERMTIFEAYRALGEYERNEEDGWAQSDDSFEEREHRKKLLGDLHRKIAEANKKG